MANNDKQPQANATASDTWYVMGADKVVFGPVSTRVLYQWAAENRIVAGSKVSTDKSSWDAAESLPLLKMDWTATLAGGREIGPFNILAVPHLFNRNILPGDATLVNRTSGKTIPVHDLVARVPTQNTSEGPIDRDGTPRPPVETTLPAGTPGGTSPRPTPTPSTPSAAVTPSAATSVPPPRPPAAPTTPVVTEAVTPAIATVPATVPAADSGATPIATPADTPRRGDPDGLLRREMEKLRKDLGEKVVQLESFVRRAETAEDQVRVLTEKAAERETSLKREVELLKKEFVATQREASQPGQPSPEVKALQKTMQEELQIRDRRNAESLEREKALRQECDSIFERLATASSELDQQREETRKYQAQAEAAQSEAGRIQEDLTRISTELDVVRDSLSNATIFLAAREAESQQYKTEAETARAEASRVQESLTQVSRELNAVRDSLATTHVSREEHEAQTRTYRTQAEAAQAEAAQLQENLTEASREMDAMRENLMSTGAALKERDADTQKFRAQAEAAQTEAARLQETLTQVSRELEGARENLSTANASLTGREAEQHTIQQLQSQLAGAESARAELETRASATSSQLTSELAAKTAQLETALESLRRAEEELAAQQVNLGAQRDQQAGHHDQNAELQTLIQKREHEIKHIEQSFHDFREAATSKTRALTAKANSDEQVMEKLRGELAESRKRLAELKAAQTSVQTEAERTRSESTRLILQHQATIKNLEMEKEELTLQHEDLETSLQAAEQECTRLQATAAAVGLLQRQEAESLRQQLALALQHGPADESQAQEPVSQPVPPMPDRMAVDIGQLQAEWERERDALETRLDAAIQSSADPQPTATRGIIIAVVVAIVCIIVGYLIGHARKPNAPIEEVIGPEVMGAGLFQSNTQSDSSAAMHNTTPPEAAVDATPTPTPVITPQPVSRWPDIKAKGCYVLPSDASCRIILNQGLFSNSTNLAPDALEILTGLAQALAGKLDDYKLIIQGHADNTPVSSEAAYSDNVKLGRTRAEIVRQILVEQFAITAASIHTVSTGELNPPYLNDTEASRLRNRTVTFELKPAGQ